MCIETPNVFSGKNVAGVLSGYIDENFCIEYLVCMLIE